MMLGNMDTHILLEEKLCSKVNFGLELLKVLYKYEDLKGVQKLKRKTTQELNFLDKIRQSNSIQAEHLQCSNLTHFKAVIDVMQEVKHISSIYQVFPLPKGKLTVEIICDNGLTWIKVIARNLNGLNRICNGDANAVTPRSVIDQAVDYLECAKLHPFLFQKPKVRFVFAHGVGLSLATRLEQMGVIVDGYRLADDIFQTDYERPVLLSETSNDGVNQIKKLNLDVSTMLAYTSSVTNGNCGKYNFSVRVLAQQAEWECLRPVKPILDTLFEGKTLYCCHTAFYSFIDIVNTVGGPNEKIRAEELVKRLHILPDCATIQDTEEYNANEENLLNYQFTKDKTLPLGGNVKERALKIFKFGDRIQAMTVTANDGFVRAARQQSINFVVFVHESRALTEQKEIIKGDPKD